MDAKTPTGPLPFYITSAIPNPASKRAPWYKNTAPTYAGIFLWFVFWQDATTTQAGFLGGTLAQGVGVGGFRLRRFDPAGDMSRETGFGQRLEDESFQFRLGGETVDGRGFFGSLAGEGFLLDEAPLHGIERREMVMALLKSAQIGLDVEEGADEVFEVRRNFDDEFGALFRGEGGGIAAGGVQASFELGSRGFEL